MWTAYDRNGRPLTTLPRGMTAQVFTANGTYTTPALCKSLVVEAVGAGGAGGGANVATAANVSVGGGGASGAYGRIYIPTPNTTYAVVIGIGGTGAASAAGTNGSNTSFGSTVLLCTGGAGGNGAMQNAITFACITGGVPANLATTTATALALANGNPGFPGLRTSVNTQFWGGNGADSPFGNGGKGPVSVTTAVGGAASGYGSGGAGGVANTAATAAGGNGAPGLIVVYEFY